MTTDQPAPYCPCNWRCHRDTQPCSLSCLSHVFEPAPTPTSSLEEAWKDHRATIDATLPVVLNQARRDFNAGWAAARAEAIREVEAMFEKYGKPDHGDWCSSIQAWNPRNRICDCGLDDALRALSQGGEGKA